MAQRSRPQAGNRTTNPLYVDSGPYAGDRWATLFRVLFTGDQQATQGVLKTVWNELAPTHPAADRNVRIDTGVGICNGHVFFNDTNAVTIGVDAGVARSDTLVMLENNTNAAIAAGAATNYNTVGPDTAIPPYSCRLAVVKGVALTQTTALFMTPLATFTTGAATFTNFTDARTFCEFATTGVEDRTRRFLVPIREAYDGTVSAYIHGNTYLGILTAAGSDSYLYGDLIVPDDYVSGLTVSAITMPLGGGNIRSTVGVYYGACSESYIAHSDVIGVVQTAMTANQNNCINSISVANATIGDIVRIAWTRYGSNVLDTTANVYVTGWIASYIADS